MFQLRHIQSMLAAMLLGVIIAPLQADTPATQPFDEAADLEARFAAIARTLGPGGVDKDSVFTYTLPRTDLNVYTDAGAIPPSVIASRFHFFKCDCGKMNVAGELVVTDYEVNDVIDALRDGMIKIVSVNPMFIGENPRVRIVRFQGEGGATQLAETIKSALDWTGEARMTTQPTQ